MNIKELKIIQDSVKGYVQQMPEGYSNDVPEDVIISEILQANKWFVDINHPLEVIREEVEKQYERQTKTA